MEWWQIYLWTRLDSISNLFITISVLGGAFLAGCIAIYAIGVLDDEEYLRNGAKRAFAKFWFWVFLFTFITLLIPDSKDFAMIYVLPKVANSTIVQKDMPDIYNLAVSAFKKKLESTVKEVGE